MTTPSPPPPPPDPLLRLPPALNEAPPAPLVIAPVSVEQKEPLIVTTTVCATGHDTLNALQMQPSPDTTSTMNEKEDANNFGGPPADYAPVYVVPAQQTAILYPMPALPMPSGGAPNCVTRSRRDSMASAPAKSRLRSVRNAGSDASVDMFDRR